MSEATERLSSGGSSGGVVDLIDELSWRGLFHQATDVDGLRRHLASGRRVVYAGFDPTADSLTIGNLVPIMMLVHVARAGHEPIVLMGGGTGLIGDPSGKSAERQLQTMELVEGNISRQRPIFERVFEGAGLATPTIVNNADWLTKLGYIEVLRDVGKHFSVNQMIQRDSVKSRLDGREHGISYTEFSYMILQAYDFLHLFRERGVSVQMGGSDQWGNILSGCDLIRRAGDEDWRDLSWRMEVIEGAPPNELTDEFISEFEDRFARFKRLSEGYDDRVASFQQLAKSMSTNPNPIPKDSTSANSHTKNEKYKSSRFSPADLEQLNRIQPLVAASYNPGYKSYGLTTPLVTKSDGGKFGKTEAGAVWLSAPREGSRVGTSAYNYYQFWLNADDADAGRFLRLFTLLPRERVEELERSIAENPAAREAQRELARAATDIMHSVSERERAEAAARALFSGDVRELDESMFREVLSSAPSTTHDRALLSGDGVPLADVLAETTLASSKSEARKHLAAGAVSVNGEKAVADRRLSTSDLLHGRAIALRRGKKAWHVTMWG